MARASVLIVLLCVAAAAMADRFIKPYRVGPLLLSTSLTGGEMVRGTVYLTDSDTVFFTNFELTGLTAIFCAGHDGQSNVELRYMADGSFVIPDGHNSTGIVIPLPQGTTARNLVWIGVCAAGNPSTVIASASVLPAYIPYLPCNTTTLSQFDTTITPAPVAGWAFLLNRVTFAVLAFDYSGQAPDARFLVGAGSPSSTGFRCEYGNNIDTALVPGTDDQDFLVHLPGGAEGQALDYLAVFCQGAGVVEGWLPLTMGLLPTLAPPTADVVLLGTFNTRMHNVRGSMYVQTSRQIELRNFFYDGGGLDVVFYASSANTVGAISSSNSITVSYDNGATRLDGRSFNDETVTLVLPVNDAITNYAFLSVWCLPFTANFGEVTFPANFVVPDAETPTLLPVEECPVLTSSITTNCYQLHPRITVSWVVDQNSGTITFNLCGCVLPNEYIAFGISGSETGALMVGGDVTWTWLDNTGVHAGDLDLTAYAQCVLATGVGACPDAQNDVIPESVSGFRDNCTTCIKFTRPLNSTDPRDRAFTPGTAQAVIWSSGPVGSISNDVTGTSTPVPFQHFEDLRPRSGELISIDFGRTPVDECMLQCVNCEVPVVPWVQPVLPHTTTISAQIGNSGGRQGYQGITGTSGWGIAWYLNSLLIPTVTVRRGTTYTFITEGGNDPADSARYHPFYITDSPRGGFLQPNAEAQTVYAGFTGTTPIGVGRLCVYEPASGEDTANELSSFEAYFNTLVLKCAEGSAGRFTWMPTEDTPDIVYYQCATHQFLGWKMNVVDSSVPLSASLLLLLLCVFASLQLV